MLRSSWIRAVIVMLAAVTTTDCQRHELTTFVPHVDLLKTIERAEKRPQGGVFGIAIVTLDGETQPALDVPAMSRIVWTTKVPDSAVLRTALGSSQLQAETGAKALFRIGISDERTYEGLLRREVVIGTTAHRTWDRVSIDLSKYGGFKWSLFYRPREKTWHIIFNTTVMRLGRPVGATDRLFWARPSIDSAR
jgi:hypothetical protein